ncbi:hypothetical protein PENTCL1PPCAC_7024, partial [Pristionchus entomophagus]
PYIPRRQICPLPFSSLIHESTMPYMIISGGLNSETLVGGKSADPHLMACLLAKKNIFGTEWHSPFCPQEVLNMLEKRGWKVVAMCYADYQRKNTWTLHKEERTSPSNDLLI